MTDRAEDAELKIIMPEAPSGRHLEHYSFEEIWQLGFKQGVVSYELALEKKNAK